MAEILNRFYRIFWNSYSFEKLLEDWLEIDEGEFV